MSKSGRIIVALALGGALGMLVALMLPQIVWWLGALAGSLIAGFAYALPDILRYAPKASRNAWQGLIYLPSAVGEVAGAILFLFGLRPKMSTSRRLMAAITWASIVSLSSAFALLLTLNGLTRVMMILFVYVPYEIFVVVLVCRSATSLMGIRTDQETLSLRKRTLFYVTPFGGLFLLVKALVRLIPFMARVGWDLCQFIGRFIKFLFILVRSKELVLVSVDTAFGVAITYLIFVRQGHAVLGTGPTLALSGFVSVLLGYFLDYQVVSRRILHLNNQKA